MFNIKSNIEYTIPGKKWNTGNKYSPDVISYICPCCHFQITAYMIIGRNYEEIIKERLNSRIVDEDIQKKINNDNVSFIQKYQNSCPSCNTNIDAEVLIEMNEEKIINCEICYSDSLEFSLNTFLALGIDIYSHYPLLFLRWWRANRSIDVVVPFINEEYFNLFYCFLILTKTYEPKLSEINENLVENPFNKLVFRKYNIVNKQKVETRKMFDNFCSNICKNPKNLKPYTLDIFSEIEHCLYIIENKAKRSYSENPKENEIFDQIANENAALVYQTYFHAKFLAGSKEEDTELFITSYNFGDIEGLQFETQSLNVIEKSEYKRIFESFENYPRIKFLKL